MFFHSLKERILGKFSSYSNSLVFWVLCTVAVLVTLLIYPSLVVTSRTYNVGDIAAKNIKAPRDLYIENTEATEENQRRAVEAVLTVYDRDEAMISATIQRIHDAFDMSRKIISDHAKALEEAARVINQTGEAAGGEQAAPSAPLNAPPAIRPLTDLLRENKAQFEKTLGAEISDEDYKFLGKESFPQEVENYIIQITRQIISNGVVANKEILLEEANRGIMLRGLQSQSEEYVQSLKRFYSYAQARTMVRVVGDPILKDLNHTAIAIIVDLSQKLIRPNISLNMQETLNRKQNARDMITMVHYKIKAGEMLLREGERVTAEHVLKLNALQDDEGRKRTVIRSIGMGFIVLFFLIAFHLVYLRPTSRAQEQKGREFLFVCLVLLSFFVVARLFLTISMVFPHEAAATPFTSPAIFAAPLAAGSMILCLFLGLEVALPFAIAMGFFASALFENPFQTWTFFFLNSTMGAYWIKECRERNVFIKAGAKVGLLNVGLVAALYLYTGAPTVNPLFKDMVMAFVGGMGAGVLTAGIVPLVEVSFGFATDIKLLELANLDKPVLRRLMLEAPGTYHHSVIVGSLVEAAATTIGANPLLARVCGYYHDIGKINKPLYFIENQMGGKNRHDKLAPSMSSLILIAHVRDGVEMANRYKLGKAIADTIQQHHGTSRISYFFEKAKQLRGEENVSEADFRYPGPKPQTKEAGLVMLADIVEAASRTLENPTPARIQGLVQRLVNNVFSDGQLDECELTLKDLHQIAKSFNQILAGIYHHRIEYIEATPKGEGKKANAGSNGQSTKNGDKPAKDGNSSSGSLKRLGLS
ncbi:MAG: HDIG domain-containing protein [Desulfatibacillum sp.]|nr:HDIG domain-containing protein [Desulfatibacillum sp.]